MRTHADQGSVFMTFILKTRVLLCCLLGIAIALSGTSSQAATPVDFDTAGAEAARYLSHYLKIDTTVPPGNERLGAEFLASILRENGIEAKLYETAPGRACIYARLKGSGKQRPIVLLNHIDVVPARAEDWTHPPFAGETHGGELWGRGAMDMKGMGIAELEAMLLLKRSGQALDRDIIFLGTPDEEVGGEFGAKWFVNSHPELVKGAEFLINEGFHIDTDKDGKPRYWGVDVGEKSVLWLQLTARGEAGHASMPIRNAATNRLIRALAAIVDSPPKPVVLPAVREYFAKISDRESGWAKTAYADIDQAVKAPETVEKLLQDKLKSSMLVNTVSLTVLKSGYKTNVIPAEATAELDCRLLPGVKHEEFISGLRKLVNDPSVDFSVLEWEHTESSPFNTELIEAIKSVAGKESPGVPVVPVVVPWFTDSHWFRELGITCYGFEPFEVDEQHLATMHGKDERIPLKTFTDGIRRLYKVLESVAVETH